MEGRGTHSLAAVSIAVLALAATAISANGDARQNAKFADAMVTATASNTFQPAAVTINQGEKVTWTNAGGNHNVTFDDGSFDEPATPSPSAWTRERTFNEPGTFRYYCEAHGAPGGVGMAGTVTVLAAAPTPPPPPPGTPPPPAPPAPAPPSGGERARTAVTLRVSDTTPSRGQRVRFFGSVRPERDGRLVQLQRRRRGGSFRTVERIRLRDAGAGRSTYSKRLRVRSDAIFRARLPADADHEAGTSRTRRVNVR
jgi:plastocyanin